MLRSREMEAFLAVAEELHFGRAAERLHMSTSGTSQAIRSLERWIGAPLFERTSRRVRLTPLGQQFLDGLKPAYDELDRVVAQARRSARPQREPLSIGFSDSVPPELQEAVVAAVRGRRPAVPFVAVPVNPMDMYLWDQRVVVGLDTIVGWTPGDGPVVSRLLAGGPAIRRSPPALLMSDRHPLAGRAEVDVEELAGLEVLMAHGLEGLTPAWVPPATPGGRPIVRVLREVRYIQTLMAELATSRLVHLTILDFGQTLSLDGLSLVPVTGHRSFACRAIWQASRETAEIRRFAEIAATAERRAG